ncbi:MAG TPA: hypothetical protein VFE40_10485 [Jatrophihabitantaceae bacterium]|jgi:hypothetical protein|nr:hypothetical protein [Jatrophihabitantaceae bacterium]
MTFGDYIFDSVLVLLVLRQVRESRFTPHAVFLPLGIIAWVVRSYLHTIPTSGNDLALIVALTAVGLAFGSISALTTRVRTDGGRYALIKAGWASAGVWVLSMGGRFCFAVWASHGGGPSLYRFSVAHDLSIDVWTAAIVLMALGEVLARTGLMVLRTRRALAAQNAPAGQELLTV